MRNVVSQMGRASAAERDHMRPPVPPPCMWCFDRGTETLFFIDFVAQAAHAWPRKVWEAFRDEKHGQLFTLAGVRTLPAPPPGFVS